MPQFDIEPAIGRAASMSEAECFDKVVEEFSEFVLAHRDRMRAELSEKDEIEGYRSLEATEGADLIQAMVTYFWKSGLDLKSAFMIMHRKNTERNYY